jgi:hypothetical protein
MLVINLYYLNLLGRLTLRPRDVILGGIADAADAAPLRALSTTNSFRRLFFEVGAREAARARF